ncbi:MAG: VCBS repeat-containing protein, partial [Oscillospiraceae bacterium]|nr:VCBS repeat-containing protein [Oscillospiraceae bacterium]
ISDGWYLVLPREWSGRVTVRRADTISGERTIVFSELGAGIAVTDILEIDTLTGDGRATRAERGGRFTLYVADSTIYAAQIMGEDTSRIGVTEDYVIENFHLIYSDWPTDQL